MPIPTSFYHALMRRLRDRDVSYLEYHRALEPYMSDEVIAAWRTREDAMTGDEVKILAHMRRARRVLDGRRARGYR
jgi:hypothetical protein